MGRSRAHRRGGQPALSDAELLCLAVAQQLLVVGSERRWSRFASKHPAGSFPYLPRQSGFGKRLRQRRPACHGHPKQARDTESWHDVLRLVDFTPMPCAASRETGKRSGLAAHAGYGYCASPSGTGQRHCRLATSRTAGA